MRKRWVGVVILVSLSCVAALAAWGFWLEPASVSNEDYQLVLPSWPGSCDGIRVAALADLHVGSPFNGIDKLQRIVDLTMAAKPDLILLLGDYVIHGVPGGTHVELSAIAMQLRNLSAPLGVFAVLGNHDHWDGAERVEKTLAAAGMSFLEDDAQRLTWKQCSFWLIGLSDFREGRRRYREALAKVPPNSPSLAFTHNPDAFPFLTSSLSLTIAGHTHGGQVYLPMLGRLIVPSRYGQRFAAGHVVEEGRHLFVSTGLGTSILPVRFLVPPEITLLTLRSVEAQRPQPIASSRGGDQDVPQN